MTKDTAEDIVAYEASRVMTHMFLISAECQTTGLNMRRIVEAQNPAQAEELWKQALGYYDADPRYTFDLFDVTVHFLPEACGHPGIIEMGAAL